MLLAEIDAQREKILEYKAKCLKYYKFYDANGFIIFVFLSIWFYIDFAYLMVTDNVNIAIFNSCIFLLYLLIFVMNHSSRIRLLNAGELLSLVLVKNKYLKEIVVEAGENDKKVKVFEYINVEFTDIFAYANSVAIQLNTANIVFLSLNVGIFLYISAIS